MAGFMSTKTKRKDLEEVSDEFSEFSLDSPARKIRRLDVELPPIMEEEDPGVPLSMPGELAVSEMVDVEPFPLTEERALVLYKPMDSPLILSPSPPNVSFRVNPDLVDGLKSPSKALAPLMAISSTETNYLCRRQLSPSTATISVDNNHARICCLLLPTLPISTNTTYLH